MKVIIHDLDEQYNESIMIKCDELIHATGKYAPCQAALAVGRNIRQSVS